MSMPIEDRPNVVKAKAIEEGVMLFASASGRTDVKVRSVAYGGHLTKTHVRVILHIPRQAEGLGA